MKLPKLKYKFEQDWIIARCRGKNVLHLGCVGDFTLLGGKDASLHYKITRVAKEVSGVDLSRESINELKAFLPESNINSYYVGNVENLESLNFPKKFDIIVAGSIIEHVSNAGLMLAGIRSCLNDGGTLLIATPHTWGMLQFLRVAFNQIESINPEHVCWYSIPTLQALCARYNFEPVEWATGYGWRPESLKWKILKSMGVPFFKLFPWLGGSLMASFRVNQSNN